jgi:hypothetical protein
MLRVRPRFTRMLRDAARLAFLASGGKTRGEEGRLPTSSSGCQCGLTCALWTVPSTVPPPIPGASIAWATR